MLIFNFDSVFLLSNSNKEETNMKKFMYAASIFAAIGLVACGGNTKNDADAAKAKADSLARIEEMRKDSMEKALAALNVVQDITTTASEDARFSTLVELLAAANLAETLKDTTKSFTVFAPTNEAFLAFDQKKLAELKEPKNAEKLKDVLLQHVVAGRLMSGDVNGVGQLQALNGKVITEKEGNVGGASIVEANIEAKNGYIHAIDKVLTPPAVKSAAKPKKPVVTNPTTTTPTPSTPTEGTVSGRGGSNNDQKVTGRGGSNNTDQKVTGRGGN